MAVRTLQQIKADIATNLAKIARGSISKQDVFGLLEDTLDTLDSVDQGKVNTSAISETSGDNPDKLMTQKSITEFVNSSINSLSAFYLTKDALGNVFGTKSELDSAQKFYYAGLERVPSKNDYLLVNADETHDNAPCRYVYHELEVESTDPDSGEAITTKVGKWVFQYKVNEFPFTAEQLQSINSGITQALVGKITKNESDISDLKSGKEDANNRVSVVNQTNASDAKKYPNVAAVKSYIDARIPTPPAEVGSYALTVDVNEQGELTYSWVNTSKLGIFV